MAIDLLDELLAYTDPTVREPEAPPRPPERPRPSTRLYVDSPPAAAPQRSRRPSTLVMALVVYALVALPTIAPATRVTITGQAVVERARRVDVIAAVRRAGLEPRDGALLSAVTHREVDRHFDPAVVTRAGAAMGWTDAVHSGDRLVLRNGVTAREPAEPRRVEVDGGGLPAVEYGLWHPPKAGANDQLVGIRSGEVVTETVGIPAVAAAPVADAVIGLSFDDGPNPATTPAILAILHSANIKATFCIVGYAARRYPELVKAIHDEGHVLCNHTMHHVQLLGRKSADQITAEIRDDSDAIAAAAGERPLFFRAPGGTWSPNLVEEVRRQGMRALGWNIDPADFERPGARVIVDRIVTHLRPGGVVLLHDGGGDRSQTVAQLPLLIQRLRKLGYGFGVPTPVRYS
jgi:peptidoglycan/xylan/chitin deacetylase (PgdA/CDA1 family)